MVRNSRVQRRSVKATEEDVELQDVNVDAKVYMACILQGRRIGVAYYDVDTRQMFVLETWEDGSEQFPSVQLIKYQVKPDVIFTSTKMDDTFLAALKLKVGFDHAAVEHAEVHEVRILRSSVFTYQQARHRLAYLWITGMDEDFTDKERLHLLNSFMNLDSEMQVRAAGGLLAVLQQKMLVGASDVEEYKMTPVQIESISELSLNGFLSIDAATHDALQIFQVDKHASSMGIGKEKEGFSLFGLLNKCVTLMGRKLLRLWFLRPILDLDILNDRLDTISVLQCSQEFLKDLQESLKHIRDIPQLLKKISSPSSRTTTKDWLMFSESVGALINIRAMFQVAVSQRQQSQLPLSDLQIVRKILSSINEELVYIKNLVTGVIDFDKTSGEHTAPRIVHGICDELDELKNLHEGLPDFLDKIATLELNRLPQDMAKSGQGTMIYMPQVGYLLRFGVRLHEDVLECLPDFQLAFEGGCEEGFFYRTSKTRELDDMIGDIFHKILDMEQAVLWELEKRLGEFSSTLRQAANVAAEVDCLTALSIVAHEQKYVRPVLTEDNILVISNGRHPLQECTVNTFVPNDAHMTQKGRVCVVSGPNYSGKSIYLKQVALIVFLAHIGSFVPAEKAIVGLTDRIFTRIASKETMAVSQSSFMIDLHQIAIMLRHATSKSLCLIDEFGKGTLTTDGVGLLCSTLKQFSDWELPPKVLACTHFSEVFNPKFLPKSENLAFYTMSILEPDNGQQSSGSIDDIVFLYRLVLGHAVPSYGKHLTLLTIQPESAGVAPEILVRANEILELMTETKNIDRLDSQQTAAKDQRYKTFTEKLLFWDDDKGDTHGFLSQVFSHSS
ncbi:unnamed protein product [Sphagnum balticum]